MADSEFAIWQGDLLPIISTTLLGPGGEPADLSDAYVYFRLLKDDVLIFEDLAVLNDPDPTMGRVRYEWKPGNTDRHGLFDAQWRGVFDGKSMRFPGNRFNRIRINRVV